MAEITVNGNLRRAVRMQARASGFTYIALLVLLAIIGIGLSATGMVFHHQAQREKEKQLLFVGEQIRRAIGRYYENAPGGGKRFPQALDELLRDDRRLGMHRYLRQVYRDPMTNAMDWVAVRAPDGGIMGVHSTLAQKPLKRDGFPAGYEHFNDKDSYEEWIFQYAVEASSDTSTAGQVQRVPERGGPSLLPPGAPGAQQPGKSK
ncbi:MAG: type II secretion system protein [Burkholderiales bacterium]|jgi:type II secretory pathway pseudopilin PulG